MMVCSMTQSMVKVKVYKLLKVGNPPIFKSYLLRHLLWELAIDH